MLLSVLTRKSKAPRLNFGPLRSRPWLRGGGPRGGQLPWPGAFVHTQAGSSHHCPGPAGSALRARSPDPAQPSSLREPGAHDPAGPQVPQATQRLGQSGPGPRDPGRPPSPLGSGGGDGREVPAASRPRPGQWAAMAKALELCGTQPPACPGAPQLTRRLRPGTARRDPGRRPPSPSYLLP